METIAISKFKATCLNLLQKVKITGQPLIVTKKGEPIVLVSPPPVVEKGIKFGCMKGTIEISGDIISPLGTDEWEVFKE